MRKCRCDFDILMEKFRAKQESFRPESKEYQQLDTLYFALIEKAEHFFDGDLSSASYSQLLDFVNPEISVINSYGMKDVSDGLTGLMEHLRQVVLEKERSSELQETKLRDFIPIPVMKGKKGRDAVVAASKQAQPLIYTSQIELPQRDDVKGVEDLPYHDKYPDITLYSPDRETMKKIVEQEQKQGKQDEECLLTFNGRTFVMKGCQSATPQTIDETGWIEPSCFFTDKKTGKSRTPESSIEGEWVKQINEARREVGLKELTIFDVVYHRAHGWAHGTAILSTTSSPRIAKNFTSYHYDQAIGYVYGLVCTGTISTVKTRLEVPPASLGKDKEMEYSIVGMIDPADIVIYRKAKASPSSTFHKSCNQYTDAIYIRPEVFQKYSLDTIIKMCSFYLEEDETLSLRYMQELRRQCVPQQRSEQQSSSSSKAVVAGVGGGAIAFGGLVAGLMGYAPTASVAVAAGASLLIMCGAIACYAAKTRNVTPRSSRALQKQATIESAPSSGKSQAPSPNTNPAGSSYAPKVCATIEPLLTPGQDLASTPCASSASQSLAPSSDACLAMSKV
jgi:hypothetical protein